MEITARVANLGKYAAGILADTELSFPTTTRRVQDALRKIGVDGLRYEEIIILDYTASVPLLSSRLGEYARIDELNYLACRLAGMSQEEKAKFSAALEHGDYGGDLSDIIDLTYRLDCYTLLPEIRNYEDYHIFKQAAGKTARSILVSAAVRLSVFTLHEVRDVTSRDTLELEKLGERKQAIFCVIPDSNDNSLNFLVGMLYTQAFQELYYQADKVHGGSLPVPVRLMFDEFANVALPDGYARLQAPMRSRNIMATIILQNISQLKALFKDDWEGIIGNADSLIYLGGNEKESHKYISELLGKETIQTRTASQSRGRNGSYSQSIQQTGRELMTPDEVRMLDNSKAIVLIRGERPVIDDKYDILKHPNIRETEDGGAAPYVHSPTCLYAAEDLSFPFTSLDGVEIVGASESDELEERYDQTSEASI